MITFSLAFVVKKAKITSSSILFSLTHSLDQRFSKISYRFYWDKSGLVTGGPYNSHEGCKPYLIPACDHHVVGHLKPCGSILPTPPCKRKCEEGK